LSDQLAVREEQVKSYEEIMEILEAYDLTGSLRDAAELAGCSHHTVGSYVKRRDAALAEGICETVISPVDFLLSWTERFDPAQTTIEYDADTHLPLSIFYDDPETADEEHHIRLIRFDETES